MKIEQVEGRNEARRDGNAESDVALVFFPFDCFGPLLLPPLFSSSSSLKEKIPTSKLDAEENVTSIAPAADPAAR